jgi:hypothetical protein
MNHWKVKRSNCSARRDEKSARTAQQARSDCFGKVTTEPSARHTAASAAGTRNSKSD